MLRILQSLAPVAGLGPATHVFVAHRADRQEDVDGRDEPGRGVPDVEWSAFW
jgi:hypothetical protein